MPHEPIDHITLRQQSYRAPGIEIERGRTIPIRKKIRNRKRKLPSRTKINTERQKAHLATYDHKYPFELLKPKESFWAEEASSRGSTVARLIGQWVQATGWKMVSRGESRDGVANKYVINPELRGRRVWRIK